jgi:hypothetical protein
MHCSPIATHTAIFEIWECGSVKTMIEIEDPLLEQAKSLAAKEGGTRRLGLDLHRHRIPVDELLFEI